MDTEEIKKKLEEQNATLTREIEYNKNKYFMAFKLEKNGIKYHYYEIKDNQIYELTNSKLIEYFKKIYEINKDIIY